MSLSLHTAKQTVKNQEVNRTLVRMSVFYLLSIGGAGVLVVMPVSVYSGCHVLLNPFNTNCPKLLLFEGFSSILV